MKLGNGVQQLNKRTSGRPFVSLVASNRDNARFLNVCLETPPRKLIIFSTFYSGACAVGGWGLSPSTNLCSVVAAVGRKSKQNGKE